MLLFSHEFNSSEKEIHGGEMWTVFVSIETLFHPSSIACPRRGKEQNWFGWLKEAALELSTGVRLKNDFSPSTASTRQSFQKHTYEVTQVMRKPNDMSFERHLSKVCCYGVEEHLLNYFVPIESTPPGWEQERNYLDVCVLDAFLSHCDSAVRFDTYKWINNRAWKS